MLERDPHVTPHHPSAPLQIRLFGPLTVQVRGEPLPHLRSRKEQWLLALLALRRGCPVERSWLAGLLWPDSSETQALSSLRRGLTDLRAALGAEAARLSSPTLRTLRLDADGVEVDVADFDAAIAAGDPASLARAVALYQGPLLEGCAEEWVSEERQPREERWLAALERLAGEARERGNSEAAVRWLRQVAAADPLREGAQRLLMEVLAAGGSHAAAILVYRELRLRLHDELNAEPDPRTAALFQRIRTDARRQAEGSAAGLSAPAPGAAPELRPAPPAEEATDAAPATATETPALPEPAPVSGRLPRALTAFVGRERELAQVKAVLEGARLVTLTGPGGVGKTRLAIQTGEELEERYPDGAWFVDLTALTAPALTSQTVASALGVREQPGRPLAATLADALRPRELLLILDNCEHLVDACAQLAQALLEACPRLRVLATSRQALGLIGEVAWPVPSLALPASGRRLAEGDEAELAAYSAVQLFVARARAANPTFRLTEANAGMVVRLLQRLDGIPLAIELAAARLRVLSVEQIAARLDDRFRLLTGGSRTALPRQQTLRATMDWSYDLLSEGERALLRRLAVFAGPFTLDAAQAVCVDVSNARSDAPDAPDVLDLLGQLVDKSLVKVDDLGMEEARYRLLETTREYACELWTEEEEATTCQRHAVYHLEWAEQAAVHLQGPEQAEWLDRLEAAHDNCRAALKWLTRPERPPADGALALRLAGALWRFWLARAHLTEGRRWLGRTLSLHSRRTAARAEALSGAAVLARDQGYFQAARALSEESLAIYTALGDQRGIARELDNVAVLACFQGDYATSIRLHETAVRMLRELGDLPALAATLTNLGWALYSDAQYDRARPVLEECLALRRAAGDEAGVARCLNTLGLVTGQEANAAAARPFHLEALAISQRTRNSQSLAASLLNLGVMAPTPQESEARYKEALQVLQELGSQHGIALCITGIAECTEWRGLSQENVLWAARLLGAGEALREALGHVLPAFARPAYERLVEKYRAIAGAEPFEAAWAEGRSLPLSEAIQLALHRP